MRVAVAPEILRFAQDDVEMIIYGLNPVLEALRSQPERIHYIAVSREHGSKLQRVIAEAKKAGVVVRNVAVEEVDRLATGGVHNGIVADLSASGYADFDEVIVCDSTTFV